MATYQNGDQTFIHPVTGVRVGPYEFYEGAAHQPHETAQESAASSEEELTPQQKAAKTRAENDAIRAEAKELGIEVTGRDIEEIKADIEAKKSEAAGGVDDDNSNAEGKAQNDDANPDA